MKPVRIFRNTIPDIAVTSIGLAITKVLGMNFTPGAFAHRR